MPAMVAGRRPATMAGMTSRSLPPLPSRFWADLSTRDFAALQSTGQTAQVVAVLPVAAVEQHGPHLPLSVDATLLQGVIDAALPHLGPMCLRCSCRRKTLA